MSISLYQPPSFLQVYAFCIDDSLPKFEPNAWIKKGKLYKLKYFVPSTLNTDEGAVVIVDNKDKEIHPSSSMSSFKESRFIIHYQCLN